MATAFRPGTAERGELQRVRSVNRLLVWVGVFTLAVVVFYGLDHGVMALQGLPLNFDLTPAQ